ncbi:MAG: hypothetical protein GY854_19945 [Deltaproteobacteria bacterium]|nr:hypothetical protein [Deltaproteobacteria bacterium]
MKNETENTNMPHYIEDIERYKDLCAQGLLYGGSLIELTCEQLAMMAGVHSKYTYEDVLHGAAFDYYSGQPLRDVVASVRETVAAREKKQQQENLTVGAG